MATLVTWQCPRCLVDNADNVNSHNRTTPTCGECGLPIPNRILTGTVIEITPNRGQTVRVDAMDLEEHESHLSIINMHGVCRIPGNPVVGDRVKIWYVSTPSSGLWFGRILERIA